MKLRKLQVSIILFAERKHLCYFHIDSYFINCETLTKGDSFWEMWTPYNHVFAQVLVVTEQGFSEGSLSYENNFCFLLFDDTFISITSE